MTMSNESPITILASDLEIYMDEFHQRVIALNPIYIQISGSATAGILLSQILYLEKARKKFNGQKEFFKTDADFCEETHLTLYELKSAKKKLTDLGIVSIVRKGIPAKSWYTVDKGVLFSLITSYGKSQQLVVDNLNNCLLEIPTTITKTTPEITTDINIYNARDARKKKPKVSFDELSVEHIKDWLAEKRITGIYIDIDEHLRLEKFKNFCRAKPKTYADYVAAFKNSFDWGSTKQIGNNNGQRNTSSNLSAGQRKNLEANAAALHGANEANIARRQRRAEYEAKALENGRGDLSISYAD